MRIVLDTNCLVVSIQEYSRRFWLWQAFRDKKIVLCYTNGILNEYQEILSRYYSESFAKVVIDEIIGTPNTVPVTVYYNWNLITADPDDNKFVDCAISANAKYIVSNDKHFKILEEIDFPKVNISTIDEFKEIILDIIPEA
jgi:putative PIN family toxin of toxin-antitoxin system